MPRNGSGTYTRTNGTFTGSTVWAQTKAAGIPMTDNSLHDTHDQDIANALSATLDKTGTKSATADLPMGSFKHTGVPSGSPGSARNIYSSLGGGFQDKGIAKAIIQSTSVGDSLISFYIEEPYITTLSDIADGMLFTLRAPGFTNSAEVYVKLKLLAQPATLNELIFAYLQFNGNPSVNLGLNYFSGTADYLVAWSNIDYAFYLVGTGD